MSVFWRGWSTSVTDWSWDLPPLLLCVLWPAVCNTIFACNVWASVSTAVRPAKHSICSALSLKKPISHHVSVLQIYSNCINCNETSSKRPSSVRTATGMARKTEAAALRRPEAEIRAQTSQSTPLCNPSTTARMHGPCAPRPRQGTQGTILEHRRMRT